MNGTTDKSSSRARTLRQRAASSFLWRGIQIARDRHRLASVPTLACDVGALRRVTASDLQRLLASDRIHADWATAGDELAKLCAVEDGATGSANPGDRRAIYYLIRGFAPATVLEIGTHVGVSTLYIAKALEPGERSPAATPALTTVDVEAVNDPETGSWKQLGLTMAPKDRLAALGCGDRVRFVNADSVEFLDGCRERFDFIFLDGDHTSSTVYREIPRALRLLEPDGVILLHDYFPDNRPLWPGARIDPGPFLATQRLRRDEPALAVLPLGELPWETKRDSKITNLAVLTRNR